MSKPQSLAKTALACALACACTGPLLVGCNKAQTGTQAEQQSQTQSGTAEGNVQQGTGDNSASGQTNGAASGQTSQQPTGSGSQAQADESTQAQVEVTNQTGYDFVGVKVKGANEEAFDDARTYELTLGNGATATVAFAAADGAQGVYDFVFITQNDSHIGFNGVNIATMKNIVLQFEQGIGYVSYTNEAGEQLSNKDETIALIDSQGDTLSTHDKQTQLG